MKRNIMNEAEKLIKAHRRKKTLVPGCYLPGRYRGVLHSIFTDPSCDHNGKVSVRNRRTYTYSGML